MSQSDEALRCKLLVVNAYFGLPSTVQFCKRCVISNQRPNSTVETTHVRSEKKETIAFDANGICDACRFQLEKANIIDWSQREEQLMALCDRHRRSSGYDVIVPGSGGKDSAFTSHLLKYKYGMNPLTVTWAPHLYTQVGWKNFQNWIHVGGLDNLLFTPNGRLHRHLTRLAFHNLLHPFQPFIVGQRIIGPRLASLHGVNLVMYGENQAEYGNPSQQNNNPVMDTKYFQLQNSKEVVLGGVPVKDIMSTTEFKINDFEPYLPVNAQQAQSVEVHYLGYYVKWDPQECFYYAAENTGFVPNENRTEGSYSKYSSVDDKIDPFHYYTTLIKFGLGRASYDAAQEIRNEKISREEGVRLVHKYDQEFPQRYFAEFLEYISTTEAEFWEVIDSCRSPHLWEKLDGEWKLKHSVS